MANQIITDPYGEVHIIIENEDGSFTSMLKSVYDEQQAALEAAKLNG